MLDDFELPMDVKDLRAHGYGDGQLSGIISSMRFLCLVGFAPEDIADAMYMTVQVLGAMVTGDVRRALDCVALTLEQNLRIVRQYDLRESNLWILTESGLAVGEIAWALRGVDGFYTKMHSSDPGEINALGRTVYWQLRKTRLTVRTSRTTRPVKVGAQASKPNLRPEPWFEHYSQVIQKAIERRPEGPLPEPSIFVGLGGSDFSMLDKYFTRAKRKAEIAERAAAGELDDEDEWDLELDDDEDVWVSQRPRL